MMKDVDINIVLSNSAKNQLLADLHISEQDIPNTELVNAYILAHILKTHTLYNIENHNILISNSLIAMYKKYCGHTPDLSEITQAVYIANRGNNLSVTTLTDSELSISTEYSLAVMIEDYRDGII